MIGIIGALEIEVERLIENLEEPVRQTCSGICYVRGRLMGREAVVTRGGIGKVNAAVCAQTMAFLYKPSLIINSGVAGALDGNLRAGDVVIGDGNREQDHVDTTALYFSGDRFPRSIESIFPVMKGLRRRFWMRQNLSGYLCGARTDRFGGTVRCRFRPEIRNRAPFFRVRM